MPHDHPHTHNHGDDHAHHHGPGHSHAPAVTMDNERRVFWVMVMTGTFMVVEAAGGMISGSLALLADAGHMMTDTAALALAWFAFRMARKPADTRRSYGYHRFQIIAAFANGLTLFAIAAWIVFEAVMRLRHPVEIQGFTMIAIAGIGLLVNVAGFWILSRGGGGNLNVRGAALHVMGDLLGSVAAIIAAIIIIWTGWFPIDPILSVLVAVLILRSAWNIIKQSAHILLEGAPADIDEDQIVKALCALPGVCEIHHLHAWSLTDERRMMTFHAVLDNTTDQNTALQAMHALLKDQFNIDHATIQIEQGQRICDATHA